jgi:hypothetical protein
MKFITNAYRTKLWNTIFCLKRRKLFAGAAQNVLAIKMLKPLLSWCTAAATRRLLRKHQLHKKHCILADSRRALVITSKTAPVRSSREIYYFIPISANSLLFYFSIKKPQRFYSGFEKYTFFGSLKKITSDVICSTRMWAYARNTPKLIFCKLTTA